MKNTNIKKYFNLCDIPYFDNDYLQLIPKKDIIPYIKYIESYGTSDDFDMFNNSLELIFKGYFDNNDNILKDKEINIDNYINIDDELIFKFPDEETAFYFKLKFC